MARSSASASTSSSSSSKPSAAAAAWSPKAGLRLTTPAVVALIGYAILVFIVLLPIDMYVYDDKTDKYVK